jgi:hypothetical protein
MNTNIEDLQEKIRMKNINILDKTMKYKFQGLQKEVRTNIIISINSKIPKQSI